MHRDTTVHGHIPHNLRCAVKVFKRVEEEIGLPWNFLMKMLMPVVYVTPLDGIKGRISVVPYGETGTIPYSKRHLRDTAFGDWARADGPGEAGKGKGSPLYHLNTWAMEWPRDLDLPAGEPDSEDDDPVDRGGAGEQEDSASEGGDSC